MTALTALLERAPWLVPGPVAAAFAAAAVLVALVVEVRTDRIPNAVFHATVVAAVPCGIYDGRLLVRVATFVVCFAIGLSLWRRQRATLGGGAVKLVAGLAALLGPSVLVAVAALGIRALVAFGAYRRTNEPQPVRTTPPLLVGVLLVLAAAIAARR